MHNGLKKSMFILQCYSYITDLEATFLIKFQRCKTSGPKNQNVLYSVKHNKVIYFQFEGPTCSRVLVQRTKYLVILISLPAVSRPPAVLNY